MYILLVSIVLFVISFYASLFSFFVFCCFCFFNFIFCYLYNLQICLILKLIVFTDVSLFNIKMVIIH